MEAEGSYAFHELIINEKQERKKGICKNKKVLGFLN